MIYARSKTSNLVERRLGWGKNNLNNAIRRRPIYVLYTYAYNRLGVPEMKRKVRNEVEFML